MKEATKMQTQCPFKAGQRFRLVKEFEIIDDCEVVETLPVGATGHFDEAWFHAIIAIFDDDEWSGRGGICIDNHDGSENSYDCFEVIDE